MFIVGTDLVMGLAISFTIIDRIVIKWTGKFYIRILPKLLFSLTINQLSAYDISVIHIIL